MSDFSYLLKLPGTPQEQDWLRVRLETLSVKESYILAAAMQRQPSDTAAHAINQLYSLAEYEVCSPAGSYEQLGEFYLRHETTVRRELYQYMELDELGQQYEDKHPGLFIGGCYVRYPERTPIPIYDGNGATIPKDNDWSVRLKLSSEFVPDGVWLRLPDYENVNDGKPDEISLALEALGVQRIQECTLLDARCVLPQAGNLMEQYSEIVDIIYDGNELGFVLDERGQGMRDFTTKYLGALDYEECDSLSFALDISQNLHCYDLISNKEIIPRAMESLRELGVTDELMESGCVDIEAYAGSMVRSGQYHLLESGDQYLVRNDQEFTYERTVPKEIEMTMG